MAEPDLLSGNRKGLPVHRCDVCGFPLDETCIAWHQLRTADIRSLKQVPSTPQFRLRSPPPSSWLCGSTRPGQIVLWRLRDPRPPFPVDSKVVVVVVILSPLFGVFVGSVVRSVIPSRYPIGPHHPVGDNPHTALSGTDPILNQTTSDPPLYVGSSYC